MASLSHKATAEANNLAAVAAAKDQYYKNMEKVGLCSWQINLCAFFHLKEKFHFTLKALHSVLISLSS
jgi:hypothetical protein